MQEFYNTGRRDALPRPALSEATGEGEPGLHLTLTYAPRTDDPAFQAVGFVFKPVGLRVSAEEALIRR